MGSLRSVSEVSRTFEEQFELRVKRPHKYWGASSCRDLKTIALNSVATSKCSVGVNITAKYQSYDDQSVQNEVRHCQILLKDRRELESCNIFLCAFVLSLLIG